MSYKLIKYAYILLGITLIIFSYGFVDRNLTLTNNSLFKPLQSSLQYLVYEARPYATALYLFIIAGLFVLYLKLLKLINSNSIKIAQVKQIIIICCTSFLLSYPAFSYDLFNYMATARVAFTWQENPWVIMPINIKNEPALAYTRAANKVALYGPTWVFLTAIPHFLGFGNVWLTIITFKTLILTCYLFVCWLIYKISKDLWSLVFFGLNPLVLMEVILGGHNDILMMGLALFSIVLIRNNSVKYRIFGFGLWLLSILVKGATIVLFPLFLLKKVPQEVTFLYGYLLMFGVFLLTPFREELYPWYFVWCLVFAAVLPRKKSQLIHALTILLTIGLLMRHAPYIYSREYGGIYQLARSVFTILPLGVFGIYYLVNKYLRSNVKDKFLK